MKSLILIMILDSIGRVSASAVNDFFFAAAELESSFENCPEGSIFDTLNGDDFSVCAPFKTIVDMIIAAGTIDAAKDQIYLDLCSADTIADCMQIESLVTELTPSTANEYGCYTFDYTHTWSGRRSMRGRSLIELQNGQQEQVSSKACLDGRLDEVSAIPALFNAYMEALDELGQCVKETDMLERVAEVRTAFQNVDLESEDPGISLVPVYKYDYGDASTYESACAESGGRFTTLYFRATCVLGTQSELLEVKDRPRCYSWSCDDTDHQTLFERYTILPTESINGPGWTCTGTLLKQTNAETRPVSTPAPAGVQPSPVATFPRPVATSPSPVATFPTPVTTFPPSPVADDGPPQFSSTSSPTPFPTRNPTASPTLAATTFSATAPSPGSSSNTGKIVVILLILAIILIGGGACFYFYRRRKKNAQGEGKGKTRDLETGKKKSSKALSKKNDTDDEDSDDDSDEDSDEDSDDDSDEDSDDDDDSDDDGSDNDDDSDENDSNDSDENDSDDSDDDDSDDDSDDDDSDDDSGNDSDSS